MGNELDSTTIKITKRHSNLHIHALSISERIHKKLVSLAISKEGRWDTFHCTYKKAAMNKKFLNVKLSKLTEKVLKDVIRKVNSDLCTNYKIKLQFLNL